MDIKNLAELQKSDRLLTVKTRHRGNITGRIERVDIQAQMIVIRTAEQRSLAIEAADIYRIETGIS